MAGLRRQSERAGDPCVLTEPRHRGQGHGRAVVAAVAREALDGDTLLLYQTLESNRGAVKLALSLGYSRYANHLAVRLGRASPRA